MAFKVIDNTTGKEKLITADFFDAAAHNAIYQSLVERLFGGHLPRTNADYVKFGRSLVTEKIPSENIEILIGFTEVILRDEYHNRKELLKLNNMVKSAIFLTMPVLARTGKEEDVAIMQRLNDIYWRLLLEEAKGKQVDSYFLYLEKNREPSKKFYQPRRKVLRQHGVTQAFQSLIDDEIDVLCISMPPGTGKTSAEKFFNSGVMGWYPDDYNLFYSHSSGITRMYYDSVYQICTDTLTYTWRDIFPELKVTQTNAKEQQFNVGVYKPFPSLQTTSVGSGNAGKVRASKFLFVDDMISSIEQALNKVQLDKLWDAYSVDAVQRKTVDTSGMPCKEIHIATRWSVNDILGRLATIYDGNSRFKAIAIPATYADENGEEHSNFEYDINGFDVEFFNHTRAIMDDISYQCLYMQEPIEREGLLYHKEDLRYYIDLPNVEPDAVIGICDTKSTGIDYMFLPVMYQYGEDFYLDDCICDDNTDFKVQYKKITDLILKHGMQQVEFESNAGGSRIAFEIANRVKKEGGGCNVTTHPTETNKETRIIVNSDWVKNHVLFKDKSKYTPKSDYGKMMNFVFTYSVSGKNKFDDVCDGLAIFSEYVTKRLYKRVRKATIMKSPI